MILGFGYFLDRFFGFCTKIPQFFSSGFHCGLQIFRFLASGWLQGDSFGHFPMCLLHQQQKKQLWIALYFFKKRGKAARIF